MKQRLYLALVFGTLTYASLVRSYAADINLDSTVDIGVISVEGTIRRPTTDLVESQDLLQRNARAVLLNEFERLEKETLESCTRVTQQRVAR